MAANQQAPAERTILVWVVCLFYLFSVVFTAYSFLAAFKGSTPVPHEVVVYLRNLSVLSWAVTGLVATLNLAGALSLFLLRKMAFPIFATALVLSLSQALFQFFTTNLSASHGSALGLAIGLVISIVLCLYAGFRGGEPSSILAAFAIVGIPAVGIAIFSAAAIPAYRNFMERTGTYAASDFVVESSDSYKLLIPAGYTFSKPTDQPVSLVAFKNYDTTMTPYLMVIEDSSRATKEQFTDGVKRSFQRMSARYLDSTSLRNGTTEIDRFDFTATGKKGPERAIMLISSYAGTKYAVIMAANEDEFSISKTDFERIVGSFALPNHGAKFAEPTPATVSVTSAIETSQAKPGALSAPLVTSPPAGSAPNRASQQTTQRARTATSKCVYKPVMTEEDLANCR